MENNWLTIEDKDVEKVLVECSKDGRVEITIPQGVTHISKSAFNNE